MNSHTERIIAQQVRIHEERQRAIPYPQAPFMSINPPIVRRIVRPVAGFEIRGNDASKK